MGIEREDKSLFPIFIDAFARSFHEIESIPFPNSSSYSPHSINQSINPDSWQYINYSLLQRNINININIRPSTDWKIF
jgi:hypothetical protein